jgi:wyosine [tRNA(Phe)-imidazoG37] synthetase (radical SAM superfamily)
MNYIFGPVPSRRLGFSLGVDILPFKTCSFDCIYCELGKTTCRTIQPVEMIPPEAVLKELKDVLAAPALTIDYITISGSGEPTLHPQLDSIIHEIKKMAHRPVALLTNSSLFYQEEVLQRALGADVIVPSLDAPDPDAFQAINRPDPALSFEQLIEGLMKLGKARGPRIWLEVLLIKGINDAPEQIEKFKDYIEKINPEKIQLNTVVRPPVESFAQPLSYAELQKIQKALGPKAEIISGASKDMVQSTRSVFESAIRDMVTRRPCSAEDIAKSLGLPKEETEGLLKGLIEEKKVVCEVFNNTDFYRGT